MNLGFFVIEIAYKVNFTIARVEFSYISPKMSKGLD